MRSLRPNTQHYTASSHQQVNLYDIAHDMRKAGLSDDFIVDAVNTALQYESVYDLITLWKSEQNTKEREEIIADIQDLIDDCKKPAHEAPTDIKLNDLDSIALQVRAFKDSLLNIVNKQGGLKSLSEKTGIPQPSLSRFFNSNAMPRRVTLLKIASALNIDRVDINPFWLK